MQSTFLKSAAERSFLSKPDESSVRMTSFKVMYPLGCFTL